MQRYTPKEIEPKWQQKWQETQAFQVTEQSDKPKKYIIDMFPYPSGAAMHVGHMRNFTISDVISQYHRQKGYNVLHTMGWDTFGLPAENYAIKTGVAPQASIKKNIAYFKQQLDQLGMSYDWTREVNTSDPEYYRWTQWIFIQLFKQGLAYQKESSQWWCETDKTVLANEQVEAGRCWRCGNEVTKKLMKQWFFKITDYADDLLEGIDDLDWPTKIKTMQRNWIGRSQGAEVHWQLTDKDGNQEADKDFVTFTTRTDTIPGVTFIVIAPESPLLDDFTTDDQREAVQAYKTEALKKSDIQRQENKEKTGVPTGKFAKNPFNGAIIPIYVADYVLAGYGTGVVMGMGGHDQRDREFSLKYGLPIIFTTKVPAEYEDVNGEVYKAAGEQVNTGKGYDGKQNTEVSELILAELESRGAAKASTQYKMRDWLISRQRYWGAPIPIAYDKDGKAHAIPEDQLPVLLPETEDFAPDNSGHGPLDRDENWKKVIINGEEMTRETDTMDGYACSSWYFLRYADPKNSEQAWSPDKVNYWLPVDFYCGGDHAVSHLLYTRFWFRFFAKQGWIEQSRREPVGKLVYNGYILAEDGRKMSKSLGNTIDPSDIISQGYGADSLRLFEMFIAPYELHTNWNTNGVPGTYRFLQRVWTLTQEFLESGEGAADEGAQEILRATHRTIQRVSSDLENLSFNTAVAALMEHVNELYKLKAAHGYAARDTWKFALTSLVQLLAPFAPHITEELWQQLGYEGSVHFAGWPVHDEQYLVSDTLTIAVQVTGKLRGTIEVAADASRESIEAAALAHDNVAKFIAGQQPKRVIYVPGRLVNIVL